MAALGPSPVFWFAPVSILGMGTSIGSIITGSLSKMSFCKVWEAAGEVSPAAGVGLKTAKAIPVIRYPHSDALKKIFIPKLTV